MDYLVFILKLFGTGLACLLIFAFAIDLYFKTKYQHKAKFISKVCKAFKEGVDEIAKKKGGETK